MEGFAGPCLSHSATSPLPANEEKLQPTSGVTRNRRAKWPASVRFCDIDPMRRLAPSLAVVLLLAACGGNDSTSDSEVSATSDTMSTEPMSTEAPATEAPPTTADPVALATAYSEPGEFPVGVTTLELAAGNKVEVWYPAVAG